MAEVQKDTAVLKELLTINGAHIVDIGSGAGQLVRYLTRQGARVTGLECGVAQLAKARSSDTAGDEQYVEGVAQALPFEDAMFDIAIFFNSLHHVPVDHMRTALTEAARVVKSGGLVYVAEPIASGSGYELFAPIDDETSVRAAAYASIQATSLMAVNEVFYDTVYHETDFASFKEDSIRIDPARRGPFEAIESELRRSFNRLGVVDEKGVRFDQPMRVNLLKKPM